MRSFLLIAMLFWFIVGKVNAMEFKFIFTTGPGSYSQTNVNIYSSCFESFGVRSTKEFRPGALGLVAVQSFIAEKPQTDVVPVLVGNLGMHLRSNYAGVNLLTDIMPVTAHSMEHITVLTNPTGVGSLAELRALAAIRPINVGVATPTGAYVAKHLFKHLAIPYTEVQYKAGTAALSDLIGGHIDMAVEIYPGARTIINAKSLVIFTSSFPDSPEYPTQLAIIPMMLPLASGMTFSLRPDATDNAKETLIQLVSRCNNSPKIVEELISIGARPRLPLLKDAAFREYIKKNIETK